jgi:outer membrane receptor protein involved in Fe transport
VIAEREGIDLPESVRQDSIWTYEVGAKAQLLDDRLSVEAAVYRSVWDDVAVTVPIGDTGFTGLGSSDGTRTWGGEFGLVARPVAGLALSVGASYVDAKFAGDVGGLGLGGLRVDEVPRFSANASADYRRTLTGDVAGVARIAWQHSSPRGFASDPTARPGDTIDRVDARLGVELDTVTLALFADNLINEDGGVSYRSFEEIEPGIDDVISNRLRPRTVGIEASFRFGGAR